MYHHNHFLAATLDATSFSQWPSWGYTLFLKLGCFGLDRLMKTGRKFWEPLEGILF